MCQNCKCESKMWQKADTWKVDQVESGLHREIQHLEKEVEGLRYRVDQLEELKRRKDEELDGLVARIETLENPPKEVKP